MFCVILKFKGYFFPVNLRRVNFVILLGLFFLLSISEADLDHMWDVSTIFYCLYVTNICMYVYKFKC